MPALARLQASDCDYPELDIFTRVNGVLTDVYSLEFVIDEDVTTPGSPIQVYPPSGRQTVDLALCPTGDKLSTGRYVAVWTPAVTEPIGTHLVRWFFKLTAASPEQTFCEEFEVLPEVTASTSTGYATIGELRAEGVTVAQADDARLQVLITRASRMIDRYTGRWFEPRSKVFLIDGTGARGLLLGPPIISISQVRLLARDLGVSIQDLDLADVRIYNRHLTQELLDPDDRESPKLEFLSFDERYERDPVYGRVRDLFHPQYWPLGTQNVEITGIFGYTDPDGSPTGRTPEMITYACMLMVIRDLPQLASQRGVDARRAFAVTEYKTRDQSVKYASPDKLGSQGVGAFTGDPTIDNILAMYTRPPELGAV